ncbi:MAG: MarR family winged helix-turn-helix transcriptional regulator [Acidimicrobiales bacterium]
MSGDTATLALFLGRLERLNESLVTDVCKRHGVSPSEFRVLAMLRHGSGERPVSPSTIAHWVVQTSGGLTATLGRLEADGRVNRVADPDDGRGRLVVLTEAGSSFHDELFDDLVERYALVLGDIDGREASEMIRTLIGAFERFSNLRPSTGWDIGAVA